MIVIIKDGYRDIDADICTTVGKLEKYGLVNIDLITLSTKIVSEGGDGSVTYKGYKVKVEELPIGVYFRFSLSSKNLPRDIVQLLSVNRIPFTTG